MDDNSNPPPNNDAPPQPPTGGTSQSQNTTPANQSQTDSVELAKELGEAKAKLEILQNYQNQVDPILVTLHSDSELTQKVLDVHNKRLGITPPPTPADGENPPVPPPPSNTELDNRNAHIANIVKDFYTETGIDKMDEEAKKTINGAIMNQLRDILDPMGNKTDPQIFADVSLTKLPKFLKDAHFLATKDDQIKAAEERGRQNLAQEQVGILGSFSSTSIEPESIALTSKEREIIAKAGWDEAKYLENKKKLAAATPNT